jgi:hypothetical protein
VADDIYGLGKNDRDDLAALLRQWRRNGRRLTNKELRNLYDYVVEPVLFRNDSGEAIPAYGVMAVTGRVLIEDATYLTVEKPSDTFSWEYAVNDSTDIAEDDYGTAQQGDYRTFLYDDGESTPVAKEWFGPVSGQWSMRKNYPCIGSVAGEIDGTATTMRCATPFNCFIQKFVGNTNASHAKGATGTIKVMKGTLGSETQIGSMTLTGVYNGYVDLDSGVRCQVENINGQDNLYVGDCNP